MNKIKCKNIIVFLILLTSLSIKAQVPNGGFELWSMEPTLGVLMPDEWSFSAIPFIAVTVTSSATSHSGSLAARGEVLNTELPYPADRLTPVLISIPSEGTEFGFVINEKYTELTGFYQFHSVGGDAFHVTVTMFHDTTGIGVGCLTYSNAASTYTPFSVAIDYDSDLNPNYCAIFISICSSSDTTETHAGSYFLVDDLELDGTVTFQDGEELSKFPDALILNQNYPNPFNSQTRISFGLQQDGIVQLSVFDGSGRLIRNLLEGHESAGIKTFIWDGMNANGDPVANGIYHYRLQTPYGSVSKKMVLLK